MKRKLDTGSGPSAAKKQKRTWVRLIDSRDDLPVQDPLLSPAELIQQAYGELGDEAVQCLSSHWSALRTVYHRGSILLFYNFRLQNAIFDVEEIRDLFQKVMSIQTSPFKINASMGVLLENVETGEMRYYWCSDGYVIL